MKRDDNNRSRTEYRLFANWPWRPTNDDDGSAADIFSMACAQVGGIGAILLEDSGIHEKVFKSIENELNLCDSKFHNSIDAGISKDMCIHTDKVCVMI
jgi:hypothetical protein